MNTKKNVTDSKIGHIIWLRRLDLNQRPSGYEPDELPNCSTPRFIAPFLGAIIVYSIVRKKSRLFLNLNCF